MVNTIEQLILKAGSLGILIGLGAASIVYSAAILVGKPPGWQEPLAAFLIISFVYNLDHLKGVETDELSTRERSQFLARHAPTVRALTISSAVLFIGLSLWLDIYYLTIGGAVILSGLLYVLPVLPGKRCVKDIPLAKNFYVPFSWTLLLFLSKPFEAACPPQFWLFAFLIYLRILIGTTTGDVRDFDADTRVEVKTLAHFLGKQKTFVLFRWLNALTIFYLATACLTGLFPWYAVALVLPTLYNSLLLKAFENNPGRGEILCEIYDFELAAYGPLLSLAAPLAFALELVA